MATLWERKSLSSSRYIQLCLTSYYKRWVAERKISLQRWRKNVLSVPLCRKTKKESFYTFIPKYFVVVRKSDYSFQSKKSVLFFVLTFTLDMLAGSMYFAHKVSFNISTCINISTGLYRYLILSWYSHSSTLSPIFNPHIPREHKMLSEGPALAARTWFCQ